jgi:uncharacterized protein YkwD
MPVGPQKGHGVLYRILVATAFLVLAVPSAAWAAPSDEKQSMLDRINVVRRESGLPAVVADAALDELALERSADMAARRYFSHTTPDGLNIFDLMNRRGLSYGTAGENLAWNTSNAPDPSALAVRNFLNSPPHRDNLLRAAYTHVGIGVASDTDKTYFTVVFKG